MDNVEDKIGYAFSGSGGVGLFFSFTEVSPETKLLGILNLVLI
jgi:hypothetical protein